MPRRAKASHCAPALDPRGFKVEAIISVDERGQLVLPKELRAKANIEAGEKLALVSYESNGHFCCCCLIKANDLVDRIKEHLGPMVGELTR